MVEVKLVEQGFNWWNVIVPVLSTVTTIAGVVLAFWLHREREKQNLKREKAEEILSEIIELENIFSDKTLQEFHERSLWPSARKLWSSVEGKTQVYFPHLMPEEDKGFVQPKSEDDHAFEQLLRFSVAYDFFDLQNRMCTQKRENEKSLSEKRDEYHAYNKAHGQMNVVAYAVGKLREWFIQELENMRKR